MIENNTSVSGSWNKSCKSYYIENNRLYAYLRKFNGEYNLDYIEIETKQECHNINGYFMTESSNDFPKNIFQTHKELSYIKNNPVLLNTTNSWKGISKEFKYNFYTDAMCDAFIKDNFEKKIYEVYKKLPLGVMRAELWKYCIIYHYGGIYADTNIICKLDPIIFIKNNAQIICSIEHNQLQLCKSVFAAPINSPILKSIIDLYVNKILDLEEIKNEDLVLIRNNIFTDGIEEYLKNNNKPTFENRQLYYNYPDSIMYIFDYNRFHNLFVGV